MALLTTALTCLALNVYHEARGEPLVGQHAVAQVTLNRAEGDPEKVCDIVLKPKQFSWTNGLVKHTSKGPKLRVAGKPADEKAWKLAIAVANVNMLGLMQDLVAGAKHYHTTEVNPFWNRGMGQVAVIGNHIFWTQE